MYRSVTADVEVTVWPEFSEERSDPDEPLFFWVYTIEIRNLGTAPVQLRARHWRITDGHGRVQEVKGPGVVGEQPLLQPGAHFRYSSGCPLPTPQGIMVGTYEMEGENGRRFQVDIPAFSLDSPFENPVLN